ncbi:MAG: hypothetical protein P8K12_05575 [Polaribacter sp.]|nr:hypothetical protein [Polaribacter sp.]MDG2151692.1 hypothetical protein [Polaribacter sp.]
MNRCSVGFHFLSSYRTFTIYYILFECFYKKN